MDWLPFSLSDGTTPEIVGQLETTPFLWVIHGQQPFCSRLYARMTLFAVPLPLSVMSVHRFRLEALSAHQRSPRYTDGNDPQRRNRS